MSFPNDGTCPYPHWNGSCTVLGTVSRSSRSSPRPRERKRTLHAPQSVLRSQLLCHRLPIVSDPALPNVLILALGNSGLREGQFRLSFSGRRESKRGA